MKRKFQNDDASHVRAISKVYQNPITIHWVTSGALLCFDASDALQLR